MYPLNVFSLFPPFPRSNKVFVAMSFDSVFDSRWVNVIDKGIREVTFNGSPLEPYRVDKGKVSDSISTEILNEITNCRLIFADITTIGKINEIPVRNGNVMYEIGIAHSVRLPEEVILFRSDEDPIPFDVANIRVNKYEPDHNPEASKEKISDVLNSCIREIDLQRNLSVKHVVDFLNFPCWITLHEIMIKNGRMKHPWVSTNDDSLSKIDKVNSINKLLELGVITTKYTTSLTLNFATQCTDPPDKDIIEYEITSFGKEIYKYILIKLGARHLWTKEK